MGYPPTEMAGMTMSSAPRSQVSSTAGTWPRSRNINGTSSSYEKAVAVAPARQDHCVSLAAGLDRDHESHSDVRLLRVVSVPVEVILLLLLLVLRGRPGDTSEIEAEGRQTVLMLIPEP